MVEGPTEGESLFFHVYVGKDSTLGALCLAVLLATCSRLPQDPCTDAGFSLKGSLPCLSVSHPQKTLKHAPTPHPCLHPLPAAVVTPTHLSYRLPFVFLRLLVDTLNQTD